MRPGGQVADEVQNLGHRATRADARDDGRAHHRAVRDPRDRFRRLADEAAAARIHEAAHADSLLDLAQH